MLRSQRYSDLVFKNVEKAADKAGDVPKRYKSLCKRAGGILRTVGLIQFMAFIKAKGAKEDHYKILAEHLSSELGEIGMTQKGQNLECLEALRRMNLPSYMNTTRAALQLLQWHKRIAEILIKGTADDHGEEE